MVKVKICGITNVENARRAAAAGADIIGLNFFSGSKRCIDIKRARHVAGAVGPEVMKAGIFVNHPTEGIVKAVQFAGLDIVQLHGNEDELFVHALRKLTDALIVKAFRVGPLFDRTAISRFQVDGVLLDAFSPLDIGGTGTVFDWNIARSAAGMKPDLYLAGGLTPANVADAVRMVRPFAVDVASGVESEPGRKDLGMVEAFIRNAKNA